MNSPMRLIVISSLLFLNLLVYGTLFNLVLFWKLLPTAPIKLATRKALNRIGEWWIHNNYLISKLNGVRIETVGLDNPEIRPDLSYLMICNHQAFTDIFVLQSIFNRKISLIKFFIKQELIFTPILGLAWWGLDFPFVKRYTRNQIKQNPKLAGKDLKSVEKTCRKYMNMPVVILNFLEGHRRTPERMIQGSRNGSMPFHFLLKPRSAGISVVGTVLRNRLHGVIDVTIVYPRDRSSFKDLLSGKTRKIKVIVKFIPIELVPLEKDVKKAALSRNMHRWAMEQWKIKDSILQSEINGESI